MHRRRTRASVLLADRRTCRSSFKDNATRDARSCRRISAAFSRATRLSRLSRKRFQRSLRGLDDTSRLPLLPVPPLPSLICSSMFFFSLFPSFILSHTRAHAREFHKPASLTPPKQPRGLLFPLFLAFFPERAILVGTIIPSGSIEHRRFFSEIYFHSTYMQDSSDNNKYLKKVALKIIRATVGHVQVIVHIRGAEFFHGKLESSLRVIHICTICVEHI